MEILLVKAVFTGLILGAVYGLIGCSLNLLYGVMRIVNFAHGEFIIAGAYFALFALQGFGVPPLAAVPIGFVCFFAVGWAFYVLLMPRLSRSDDPESTSFLVMFGFSLMATALMLLFFEADPRSLGFSFRPLALHLGPVVMPTSRLAVLGVTALIVALLSFGLYGTDHGRALRAAMMNRDAIQIVGVDIHRLSAAACGIGMGLAGVTGILVSMVFPAFSPFVGADYTLIGFIVIVLGGLGNPVGGLLGGVLFGLTEQVASVYMSHSFALAIGFAMMVGIIVWRPQGLFAMRRPG
ncbi:MAG: branched-chain amino acid ABC transporter permease [Rhodospirillaceae bacterium]